MKTGVRNNVESQRLCSNPHALFSGWMKLYPLHCHPKLSIPSSSIDLLNSWHPCSIPNLCPQSLQTVRTLSPSYKFPWCRSQCPQQNRGSQVRIIRAAKCAMVTLRLHNYCRKLETAKQTQKLWSRLRKCIAQARHVLHCILICIAHKGFELRRENMCWMHSWRCQVNICSS